LAGYEVVHTVFFDQHYLKAQYLPYAMGMDRIKTIIRKDPQVISINALWGRNSGPFRFIEADIAIKAGNFERAHFVSQRIERESFPDSSGTWDRWR
jgi:hypothetical protein